MNVSEGSIEFLRPDRIRARLTELTTEANFLRALLRLLEKNRGGHRFLRLRSKREIGGPNGR